MQALSIVVPVFNEAPSLRQLHREIADVLGEHNYTGEIIFVDDGSRDESWTVIQELASQDSRIRAVRFRRNFGKAAALSAGFAMVRHPRVLTLDADLQDDPREIPAFLAKVEEGFDVVSGWKKIRHDPWHKVFPSRIFNWMVSGITGVRLHDHNCGMKCYRREVLEEVVLYGELHRFVPVLAAARGFTVGELVIHHRPRQFGKSKYGVSRFVKGFLDLLTVRFLTGFGQRPQHVLGTVGLVSFALGAVILTSLATLWIGSRTLPGWTPITLHDRPLVVYATGLLLLGGQMMSIGFLAELFLAYHVRPERIYSIAERIDGPPPHPGTSTV